MECVYRLTVHSEYIKLIKLTKETQYGSWMSQGHLQQHHYL